MPRSPTRRPASNPPPEFTPFPAGTEFYSYDYSRHGTFYTPASQYLPGSLHLPYQDALLFAILPGRLGLLGLGPIYDDPVNGAYRTNRNQVIPFPSDQRPDSTGYIRAVGPPSVGISDDASSFRESLAEGRCADYIRLPATVALAMLRKAREIHTKYPLRNSLRVNRWSVWKEFCSSRRALAIRQRTASFQKIGAPKGKLP